MRGRRRGSTGRIGSGDDPRRRALGATGSDPRQRNQEDQTLCRGLARRTQHSPADSGRRTNDNRRQGVPVAHPVPLSTPLGCRGAGSAPNGRSRTPRETARRSRSRHNGGRIGGPTRNVRRLATQADNALQPDARWCDSERALVNAGR